MSRLPFELLLALRYLRPKRTFVSVITLISVLGVTLGVAVLIIVISVMSGFDRDMREKVFGFNAHITISQFDKAARRPVPMTNAAAVMKAVAGRPGIKGCSPFISLQVVVKTEPVTGRPEIAAPYLRGVDPDSQSSLGLIVSNIISGTNDLSGRGILVGEAFASEKDIAVGDHLALSSPQDIQKMDDSRAEGKGEIVPPADYEVRGIFDTGFYEYNSSVVITSLENAQDMTGLGNDVQGVLVMLDDPSNAPRMRATLESVLGPAYYISTWMENNTAMNAVLVEKNVMFYILFFIVIVAAFGITCTLITFVVLKTREIGIMKALGASSRQVMWIFLCQSMVVSLFGVIIGTALGLLAVAYRNPFLHLMRSLTGRELFPAKIYFFSELPAQIVPGDLLVICGGSFIICLLAAAFPVWNASRLKPVEALRHE
jgi:lipoprotein-releasing system permease protein